MSSAPGGSAASNCRMAVALMLKLPVSGWNTQYGFKPMAAPPGAARKPSLSCCKSSAGAPARRNARPPGSKLLFGPSPVMVRAGGGAGRLPSSSASTWVCTAVGISVRISTSKTAARLPLLATSCACWSLPVSPGVEKRTLPSLSSTSLMAPLALTLSAPSGMPRSASGSSTTCAGRTGGSATLALAVMSHTRPPGTNGRVRSTRSTMASAGVTVAPGVMLPACTSPSMMLVPGGVPARTARTCLPVSLPLLRMLTRNVYS
ncbi:hypothetical protein JaAD80_28375 [Janthinobacterium sp. AD80]|nr:hypothetical protein JaAD80_28375 [Janthinobacterium sp. AD80]